MLHLLVEPALSILLKLSLLVLKNLCIIGEKSTMGKVKYIEGKLKKTSITLSPYYQEIIQREMLTGKFNSVSQLVSHALLLVEKESLLLKKAKNVSKN